MILKKTPSLRPSRQRGSAYVELALVFVFIAALFAIVVPTYFNYLDKAKLTLARNTVDTIDKALDIYHLRYRTYPAHIDFATGQDGQKRPVFTASLLEKIGSDLTTVDSYQGNATTFTLTVHATNQAQTRIVLTPKKMTYQENAHAD